MLEKQRFSEKHDGKTKFLGKKNYGGKSWQKPVVSVVSSCLPAPGSNCPVFIEKTVSFLDVALADLSAIGLLKRTRWGVPYMGNPHSWMVDFMENPIQVDDLGVHLCQETPI